MPDPTSTPILVTLVASDTWVVFADLWFQVEWPDDWPGIFIEPK